MLSRHFLRAKALQSIYAGVTGDVKDSEEIAKLFDYNVRRLNDLGVIQLSTLGQLTFTAHRIAETSMQKFNPAEGEKNPSFRFVENKFIEGLEKSAEYKQQLNRLKIDWSDNFDIFRKVFNTMKNTQQYKDYMEAEECNFEDDKAFTLLAFKCLMNEETLRDIIFERELLWEDDFDQVAQYNFMMMKEIGFTQIGEYLPCPMVYDERNEKDLNDYEFARKLAVETFKHIDDTEPLIRKHLQNWEMDRVALMDVLLINMAVEEFTGCPSIPERVTVDEYIELSKEFSTEKSKLFINGILDKILIELRAAGKIEKDSRGLYDPLEEIDETHSN